MSRTWDRMSLKEQQGLQDALLREFIWGQIYPYHSFYRQLFASCRITPRKLTRVSDLLRFPQLLTTKEHILAAEPGAFVLQPSLKKIIRHNPIRLLKPHTIKREYMPVIATFTTGRSSNPVLFDFTTWDRQRLLGENIKRIFGMLGPLKLQPEKGEWGASLFPAVHHLAHMLVTHGAPYANTRIISFGGRGFTTEKILERLKRLPEKRKPSVILSTPGYLKDFLAAAEHLGCTLPSVRAVIAGGEALPSALRQELGTMLVFLGARDPIVLSTYGFTEGRHAIMECVESVREGREDCGYHTFPDFGVFQVVRVPDAHAPGKPLDELIPCAEGEEGMLVYTPLKGRGTIVLLWPTWDFARMTTDPCPACGRTDPRILPPIRRRTTDMVKTINGTQVDFNEAFALFAATEGITEWQLVVRDGDHRQEIVAFVSVRDGIDQEPLRARLKREFSGVSEVSLSAVFVVPHDELRKRLGMDTEFKEKRLLDERKSR